MSRLAVDSKAHQILVFDGMLKDVGSTLLIYLRLAQETCLHRHDDMYVGIRGTSSRRKLGPACNDSSMRDFSNPADIAGVLPRYRSTSLCQELENSRILHGETSGFTAVTASRAMPSRQRRKRTAGQRPRTVSSVRTFPRR